MAFLAAGTGIAVIVTTASGSSQHQCIAAGIGTMKTIVMPEAKASHGALCRSGDMPISQANDAGRFVQAGDRRGHQGGFLRRRIRVARRGGVLATMSRATAGRPEAAECIRYTVEDPFARHGIRASGSRAVDVPRDGTEAILPDALP